MAVSVTKGTQRCCIEPVSIHAVVQRNGLTAVVKRHNRLTSCWNQQTSLDGRTGLAGGQVSGCAILPPVSIVLSVQSSISAHLQSSYFGLIMTS